MKKPIALLVIFAACTPPYIPGTKIEDTRENRSVLDVIGAYKQALEGRNVEGVISLCSPKYYEDNGNSDPTDDYGYSDLRTRILPETFLRLSEVRLEIEVKEVKVAQKRAIADLRYLYQAKMALPSGEKWHADTELNRVELEQEDDGSWKIVRGL
jgi:ketosteroid isomerase-like protein